MVTIYDIAKKAKVSPNTVSRVLNGKADYIRPTFSNRADRIREMAASMGYRPNATAQSMKTGKHSSISLLTSPIRWSSAISSDFLFSIQSGISDLKYSLVLNTLTEGGDSANRNLPRIFKENCVDGVLVNITHAIPEWLEPMLKDMGVPFVWIGSKHQFDCVYHDDMGAAQKLTSKLLQAGHRNIVYVDCAMPWNADPADWHFSNIDRMNGYRQAMDQSGNEPIVIRPDALLKPDQRVSFLMGKIFNDNIPTAIISYDLDFTGETVLFAAARKGIDIPADLSYATFNPHSDSCLNDLNISHFGISPQFSEGAVQMLFRKICNDNQPAEPVVLPMVFNEGNTISNF